MATRIPKYIPRRPLDNDQPDGYQESDKDYVLSNIDLAVMLLDKYGSDPTILEVKK